MPVERTNGDRRQEVITERLRKMGEWAKERRGFLSDCSKNAWHEDWYIRIGGNGFTSVSVNDNCPLVGYASAPVKRIRTVTDQFLDSSRLKEPRRKTPERRVQSWLVKQALAKDGDLSSIPGLKPPRFDRLTFVLDEVSLGDRLHTPTIRCDMLAVGTRARKASLVIMELKSARNLEDLRQQLKRFKNEVLQVRTEFEKLMANCVGYEVSCAEPDIGMMLIWPSGKESLKTKRKCQSDGVDVIEYSWDPNHEAIGRIVFHSRSTG